MIPAARSRTSRRLRTPQPLLEPLEDRTLLSIATASAVVVAHGDSATAYIVGLNRGRVTGTVTFTDGASTTYGTVSVSDIRILTAFVGTATISLRLPVGAHTVVATYSGDAAFASSHATAHSTVLDASIVTLGAAFGQRGTIRALDFNNGISKSFQPFGNFNGAINVAAGDVNGDGFPDLVVALGSNGPPLVEVIDFRSGQLLRAFFAFDASFSGGVNVAVADVNGDAHDDIIVGMATRGSQVREFSGINGALLATLNPFGPFTGGARVAAGDIDGDGTADVAVTTGPGATLFKVFLGDATTASMTKDFGGGAYHGGGYVTIGDFDHSLSNAGEIIVSFGANSAPVVQVYAFNNNSPLTSFFAYPNTLSAHSGVYVVLVDVNHDGTADFVTNLAGTNLITIDDGATGNVNQVLTGVFTAFDTISPGFTLSAYNQGLITT